MIEPPPFQSPSQWQYVIQFVWRVLSVRWRNGCMVSSWWRSPISNARAGGHPESQHLLGLALDVYRLDGDYGWERAECDRVGLIGIDEGTHLHVQLFPAGHARSVGLFSDDVFRA